MEDSPDINVSVTQDVALADDRTSTCVSKLAPKLPASLQTVVIVDQFSSCFQWPNLI